MRDRVARTWKPIADPAFGERRRVAPQGPAPGRRTWTASGRTSARTLRRVHRESAPTTAAESHAMIERRDEARASPGTLTPEGI